MVKRTKAAPMPAETSRSSEDRARLHELVDQLLDKELPIAVCFLEFLQEIDDPLLRQLRSAPYDDEPLTEEESAAIREGAEQFARGEGIPLEKVEKRLGL